MQNTTTITIPPTTEGEKWVGIILKEDGTPDYHLIRMSKTNKKSWKAANEWAEDQGGDGPTLRELGLLRVSDAEYFESDWYWSSEQHASYSNCAWCQSFGSGFQYGDSKSAELCAVAVRRVTI